MDIRKLWSAVLEKAKESVSQASYQTWFDTTSPKELINNKLIVETENAFQKDWLEGRYYDLLKRLLNDMSDSQEPFEIVFVSKDGVENATVKNKSRYISNKELLKKIEELDEKVENLESLIKSSANVPNSTNKLRGATYNPPYETIRYYRF